MISFEEKILKMIEEKSSVLFEIERVLFTQRYRLANKHFEIFAVQSISMMYSIWEGFIQQVFQLYISELNKKELDFINYSDEIVVFHMENTFKQLYEYPEKVQKKVKLYADLNTFYNQDKHLLHTIVNTESNVSFETLNKLLHRFSLEQFPKIWGDYKYPKPNLQETMKTFLRYRNAVAHGGDISSEEKVTQEVYGKYKKLVLDLMYEIQNKMSDGLSNKTYLKM